MIRATGLLDSAFAWPSGRASLLAAASGSEEYPNHNAVCKTVAADTRRRRRRNRETAAVVFIGDRKSTRLNSSHSQISYAVFCLKKKKYTSRHSTLPLVVIALNRTPRGPGACSLTFA